MLSVLSASDPGHLSTVCSVCAISCWLVALLPQQYRNYKRQSVSGLSPWMLVFFFCADLFNLIGCIMTNQMRFQVYNSCYALANDTVLFFQFWYYGVYLTNKRGQQKIATQGEGQDECDEEEPLEMECSITSYGSLCNSLLGSTGNNATLAMSGLLMAPHVSTAAGLPLLEKGRGIGETVSRVSTVGTTIACLCALCYICARIPQLYKNHQHKTTSGMSPFFAGTAIVANGLYSSSILTSRQLMLNKDPVSRMRFFKNEMPYLVGNWGSILLDVVFFCQFFRFGDHRRASKKADDLSEVTETSRLM